MSLLAFYLKRPKCSEDVQSMNYAELTIFTLQHD